MKRDSSLLRFRKIKDDEIKEDIGLKLRRPKPENDVGQAKGLWQEMAGIGRNWQELRNPQS